MTIISGYQDGWNTPGWTAQWGYLPNNTRSSPDLFDITTLPVGLKALAVTANFADQYGAAWGYLHFTPSINWVQLPSESVNLTDFRLSLRDGQLPMNFILPMPDVAVAGVSPVSFAWNVTGRIGSRNVSWSISVPTASPLNLSSLPVDSAQGQSISLGATPEPLNLTLTANSGFVSTITRSDMQNWPTVGFTAYIQFNDVANTQWAATVSGSTLSWSIPESSVNTIIAAAPTNAILYYSTNGNPVVWASGRPTFVGN